jgi:hypothetical protein
MAVMTAITVEVAFDSIGRRCGWLHVVHRLMACSIDKGF